MLVDGAPGSECDAVRARAGVLGLQDGVVYVLDGGDDGDVLGGDPLLVEVVVGLRLDVLVAVAAAAGPDLRPAAGGYARHDVGVGGGGVPHVFPQGGEARACRGEVNFDLVEGILLAQTGCASIVHGLFDPSLG
jgi:hypothetical protein